jgi:carbonic anhydrase
MTDFPFKASSLTMAIILAAAMAGGCSSPPVSPEKTPPSSSAATPRPLVEKVLTAEEQRQLTPDAIIASFKEGNQRFAKGDLTIRDHTALVRRAAAGQFPKAVILSCLDSRIPVEDVFDKGIGDIFVARVAGNIVNEDILGSMEFGCKVAGAKVIMVLGHKHCGAVKGAIDDVRLGNITALLSKIRPAVQGLAFDGEKNSKNSGYVDAVAKANVRLAKQQTRERSAILKEMEAKGELKIIGAFYDLDTGQVVFDVN